MALLLAGALPSGTLCAQLSPEAPNTPQFSYEQRYGELRALQAAPNRVAPVTHLVLKRDAGQFTFGAGTFYQLTPIGGRTMGAVFVGHGIFSFSPPTRLEQERLAIFQKTRTLEVPFSSVVLLFADSTLAELESKLTFGPGQPPSDPRSARLGLILAERTAFVRWGADGAEELSIRNDRDIQAAVGFFPRIGELLRQSSDQR